MARRRVKTAVKLAGTGGLVLQLDRLEAPKDLGVKTKDRPSLLEALRMLLASSGDRRRWVNTWEGLKVRKVQDYFIVAQGDNRHYVYMNSFTEDLCSFVRYSFDRMIRPEAKPREVLVRVDYYLFKELKLYWEASSKQGFLLMTIPRLKIEECLINSLKKEFNDTARIKRSAMYEKLRRASVHLIQEVVFGNGK